MVLPEMVEWCTAALRECEELDMEFCALPAPVPAKPWKLNDEVARASRAFRK